MIGSLGIPERRVSPILAIGLAILGFVMLGAARKGSMAAHGATAPGILRAIALAGSMSGPDAPAGRAPLCCDEPTRFGIAMTFVRAMIGMGVGAWVAAPLHWPAASGTHTAGVIFGFGGTALIAASLHVLQRLSHTPRGFRHALVRADRLQSVLRLVGVGSAVGGLVAAFAFALSLLSIPMLRPSGGRR